MTKPLSEIRKEIDRVDESIASALVERAKLAKAVRDVKQGSDLQVYHPSREREILDSAFKICADSGFTHKQVEKIFLSVISACRSIVGDIEVCLASGLGSLAHAAAVNQFGPIEQLYFLNSVKEVFSRIDEGSSQYGVVPVSYGENGILGETLFAFLSSSQMITAEIRVSNECSLFSQAKKIEDIKEIYVESELYSTLNLGRLRTILKENVKILPHTQEKELGFFQELKNHAGFLAPNLVGSYINLPVLIENLDLSPSTEVSFFVIGAPEAVKDKHNVVALVCVVKDRTGALREILEPFEKESLTLLALESRSSKHKKWECAFYIEVKSEPNSPQIQKVVDELNDRCSFVRVLGSFYRE